MVFINPPPMSNAEPCIVTGELWVLGDVGEDAKYELVWEFEDCENGIEEVSIRSKGLTCQEFVLGLV